MTQETWSSIKTDYVIGKGSLRALAARYALSPSTVMKRAGREHWTANRALAVSTTDATMVATMAQRAEAFVNRSAEQTDRFLTRVSESEAALETEDRQGLRLLASTLKDVVAVGRDTYNLGSRDEGGHCLVNLGFLASYIPEMTNPGNTEQILPTAKPD